MRIRGAVSAASPMPQPAEMRAALNSAIEIWRNWFVARLVFPEQ